MGWWSILKSSREEAYAEFVKEYGPEVELDSLKLVAEEGYEQVQIDSPDSEWFITYTILSSGEEQFTFESESKYLEASTQTFVEGMFEQEYPERYQELLEMARGALAQYEVDSSRPYFPTYQRIINLLEKRIHDLGLLEDTDYATDHELPFGAVLERSIVELKMVAWPSPGSPLPRINTIPVMFNAVLDEFITIYSALQRSVLAVRDRVDMRLWLNHRKLALKGLIVSSFIVSEERIAPKDPDSQYLADVLSIIEVEKNLRVE